MLFQRILGATALLTVTLTQTPAFARSQDSVTPYDDLQSREVLTPGQTYLTFMEKNVKPSLDAFQEVITGSHAFKSKRWGELQGELIAQGAGVAIRIDSQNYLFNVGYLDGSDAANDVKSGRSYGVGPRGTQSDPSDIAYLRELEHYLKREPGAAGDFIEALMLVLTDCDPSGWSKLSVEGQSVATDFLAIYTAELDRHLMVHLNPRQHPWEIDLAAATFVSIFSAESGLILKDGKFVEGNLESWWAQGQSGSGIGNTRRDRLSLQARISKVEAGSSESREIANEIGARANDDLIQGVLLYLNSSNAPASMGRSRLPQAVAAYLVNVQKHTDEIARLR
ncbi:MAG: hypothetical protein ACXVBW_08710 [Bdellovibrionota bacterium]